MMHLDLGVNIPNYNDPVPRTRRQVFAIWADRNFSQLPPRPRAGCWRMPHRLTDGFECVCIPEAYSFVLARSSDEPPVGDADDVGDPALVSTGNLENLFARNKIPNA